LTFNPYTGCDHACLYCYASNYIPKFFNCKPKKDLIPKLKKQAAKLKGEIVSIANSSDPYPNLEAETCLTRKCLEILSQNNCKIQIITKSPLVTRDIDLLKKKPSMVSLTITTDNDNTAKLIEPHAPPPSERLKAAEILIQNAIPTSARIDPIIPFVNDNPENLIKTLAYIGVKHITGSTYKVKLDNWKRLSQAMPKVAQNLKPLYFEKGEKTGRYVYLPKDLRLRLMKTMSVITQKYNMKFGTCRENLGGLNTAICDGSWLLS
jgi:DNA repair photolyase